MIVLEKNNIDQEFMYERYRLNELCRSDQNLPSGFLIAWLLASGKDSTLDYFLVDFTGNVGETRPEERLEGETFHDRFPDLQSLCSAYSTEDFHLWDMSILFQGEVVCVSGNADSPEVSVTYDTDKPVNVIPLLANVEDASWKYHGIAPNLLEKIQKAFSLSEINAVKAVVKLRGHPDIYEEFLTGIQTVPFCYPLSPLRVEGYSARELEEQYPLSILGAYNYLIYLRMNPVQAIQDLKNGLKIK